MRFKERGVGVINASAIGMGLLSTRGPAVWHPAQQDIKDACNQAALFCQVGNKRAFEKLTILTYRFLIRVYNY